MHSSSLTLVRYLLLGTLPALACGCSPVRWEGNYQRGLAEASQLRRRALVQVHSNVSGDCRQMEDEVFSDPEVQKLLQGFVPIRVDAMLDRVIVEQLGVQVVPTFLVIRPDLTVAGSHAGTMSAEKFRIFLIKNTYN